MKKNIKIALCLITVAIPPFFTQQIDAKIVIIESEEEYRDTVNNGKNPMVVQFAAEWCGACQAVKQQVESISDEPEFENIVFARADLDKVSAIAEENNVTAVPNFLYMKDGKVQKQAIGFKNLLAFKDEMRENIRQHCMQNHTKDLLASNGEIGHDTLQQRVTKDMEAQANELADQFPLPELEKVNKDTQEAAFKKSEGATTQPEALAKLENSLNPTEASMLSDSTPTTQPKDSTSSDETSLLSTITEFFTSLIYKIKDSIQKIVDAIAGLFRK